MLNYLQVEMKTVILKNFLEAPTFIKNSQCGK